VQAAAINLIEKLKQYATNDSGIKFGLVPIDMAINLGMNNAQLVDGANNPLFSGAGRLGKHAITGIVPRTPWCGLTGRSMYHDEMQERARRGMLVRI
jgi:hypothetical protein